MPRLHLRIHFDSVMFGPGKAELLARIHDTGSIAAAGRQMGMSYKRAWTLVEEMNAAFSGPLVESARGGTGGGGARLTKAGAGVLRHYRGVQDSALAAAAADLAALEALLRPVQKKDMSSGK